ncbi:50s ribosomal protein mrp49 [Diplodia corticola]|uniref:50s ribosomal protein mrp49 n=1 Tax=Diplodia corticola TaxID=236234 RepID=A0A1J9QV00_9PEZI|nr:50s ribosomal protein mrp49 [Diplodia corticola]OJD31802.1 50s ribosomal protein mrp49 [Diplodia corticola]
MPTIGQRMFKLKQLLGIRLGPGAAVMPKEVKKITMRFAPKIDDGHAGPKYVPNHLSPRRRAGQDESDDRRFFRKALPRLQYRNPALRVVVDRRAAQSDPPIMNVFFDTSSSSSTTTGADPAAAPTVAAGNISTQSGPNERIVTIHMKDKTDSEILQQLYEVTGAQEIEPTEVEKDELRELAERAERSRRDSELQAEVNRQRKREAQLLAAARGQVGLQPS